MGIVFLVLFQNSAMAFFTVFVRQLTLRHPGTQFQLAAITMTGLYLCSLPIAFLVSNIDINDLWRHLPIFLLVSLALGLQSIVNFWILRYMDAAISSLVGMLGTISTIIMATVLLGEGLTLLQLVGAAIILGAVSSVLITKVSPHQRNDWTRGLLLATAGALLLAIGVTGEKYLLGQVQLGSYIGWGWGLQTLIVLALGFMFNAKQFKAVLKPRNAKLLVLATIARVLLAFGFVASMLIIDNASKVMVLCGLKVILATLLGMIILHERQFIRRKLVAAVAAALGTVLLFL